MPLSAAASERCSATADLSLRADLARRYLEVRTRTEALAAPLSPEDQCVQSMPDASPTKWHLAHTSWFFEVLVLQPHLPGYAVYDARYHYLFNSYYESLGPRHPRPQRGLLTRPSACEVLAYRHHVDEAMQALLDKTGARSWHALAPLLTLGLQHEEQHQELLLTDALHLLSCNPMLPAYAPQPAPALRLASAGAAPRWLALPEAIVHIGHDAGTPDAGFAFDNEGPRHRRLITPCMVADRLVTCGEFARFIDDGGYRRPELWLSEGWATVQAQGWQAPAYWIAPGDPHAPGDAWQVFGLAGVRPLDAAAPVAHLSFYEAAAYAQWAGARLPTEFEWEIACALPELQQAFGHVWQWTRSAYEPYPGFAPLPGAVAEYNGKFMVGQLVLRGSSQATPSGHSRPTYRNFFPPAARWQFTGLRLARDMAPATGAAR